MYPKVVYQPDKSKVSSELYGNGSRINYTYNPYGQVFTKTSVGLGTVTSKHDALGNLIFERDEPGGIKTYYQYDSEGRLYGEKVVTSTVANTSENFLYASMNAFDEDGNVTKNSVTAGDRTFSTSYDYTESGLPEQAMLATTRKVDFTYNEDDVLIKRTMSTSSPLIQLFEYDENGLISGHALSHGNDEDIVYSYSYTYDDNGNITEIKKGDVVQQSYVYDANNQLVRENNVDINKTIVYDYDDGGNIETKTEYAFTLGELGAVVDTVNYTYDTEWKDKLTSYDGKSISYDAIGNPINYMGAEMTWFARQMMSYETDDLDITYKYDSDGLRTQKVVNGVKHEYYYVDGLLVYENIGDENLMYYRYDRNGTVIAINRIRLSDGATGLLYPVTNSRGDVVELRNGSGVLNAKYTYDSWGKLISITDANGNPVSEDSLAMFNSIRYRGYVYDRETGLYYLQSRYYDPETGRFLNADDVDYIGYSGEVISYNVFAYCENGPVCCKDSNGSAPTTALDYAIFFAFAIMILYEFYEKQITINIDTRKDSSPTKGSITIDLTNKKFYNEIVENFKINNGKNMARTLAYIALVKFEDSFYKIYNKKYKNQINNRKKTKMKQREFLFSVDCVTEEIYDHMCGFLWSKGESVSNVPFYMLGWASLNRIKSSNNKIKKQIEEKCKTIDIFEADVVLKKDQVLFYDYYNGISDVYKYKDFDPYVRTGLKKKSIKEGWLES